MWKVQDPKIDLPAGFSAAEDRDGLLIRCGWCGHEARYSARSVDLLHVEADAWGHLAVCPTREGRDAHRAR